MKDDAMTDTQGGEGYFCPPAWLGLIKQLVHMAQFSGGLQVLDGVRGAGKTVIAQQLANALGAEVSFGVLALPAGLQSSQVFDCLLTSLGVSVREGQSVGESIIALRQLDSTLKVEQLRKVLIIDDAHNFDDQALAALASVFQGSNETEIGLSVIFIAEPGLAQRLDALNLVDIEVRDSEIPGFSLQEAKDLVTAEFARSYPDRTFSLEEELVVAIWNESGGRPGDMLQMSKVAWLERDDVAPSPRMKIPVWHVLALLLLLAVLILGYLSNTGDDVERLAEGVSLESVSVGSSLGASGFVAGESSYSLSNASTAIGLVESSVMAITGKDLDAFGVASSAAAVPAESSLVASSQSVVEIPEEKTVVLGTPVAKVPAVALGSAKPAIAPVARPARKAPSLDGLNEDEAFLMGRPSQGYVLQVLAAKSRKSLEGFVVKQVNSNNIRIYRSLRSGKSWYVAVEGFYADKGSALAAMSNLPKEQLQAGPWPKSIAAVKLEIAAFKQQKP